MYGKGAYLGSNQSHYTELWKRRIQKWHEFQIEKNNSIKIEHHRHDTTVMMPPSCDCQPDTAILILLSSTCHPHIAILILPSSHRHQNFIVAYKMVSNKNITNLLFFRYAAKRKTYMVREKNQHFRKSKNLMPPSWCCISGAVILTPQSRCCHPDTTILT